MFLLPLYRPALYKGGERFSKLRKESRGEAVKGRCISSCNLAPSRESRHPP